MADPAPPPLISLPLALDSFRSRLSRENTQILIRLLKIIIYNSTVPFSFEPCREDIYTIPFIREHHGSYHFYIDTHSLTSTMMNLLSLSLSSLLSILLIHSVKTFTPPIFIFPLLMFSQLFSKTSRRRIISYLNIF